MAAPRIHTSEHPPVEVPTTPIWQASPRPGLADSGASVVLPRFDLLQFLDALEQHRITRASVAPPVVLALAEHPAVEVRDFSAPTFILSAAAPLDAELAGICADRLGVEIG